MQFNYAGFGVRFLASLIDGIIIGLANTAINFMLKAILGDGAGSLSMILNLALSVAYYVWYQNKNGQTIGKKAMNIKVVTYEGKTPTMFAFFLRDIVGKIVSTITLFIGYLMVLWDPKKQSLHDKIASTYVIRVEEGGSTPQATTSPMTPSVPPAPPSSGTTAMPTPPTQEVAESAPTQIT